MYEKGRGGEKEGVNESEREVRNVGVMVMEKR